MFEVRERKRKKKFCLLSPTGTMQSLSRETKMVSSFPTSNLLVLVVDHRQPNALLQTAPSEH